MILFGYRGACLPLIPMPVYLFFFVHSGSSQWAPVCCFFCNITRACPFSTCFLQGPPVRTSMSNPDTTRSTHHLFMLATLLREVKAQGAFDS